MEIVENLRGKEGNPTKIETVIVAAGWRASIGRSFIPAITGGGGGSGGGSGGGGSGCDVGGGGSDGGEWDDDGEVEGGKWASVAP
ncbi:hypothetical protein L6452_43108 [Arctium lappa]|uniref:Uncharacterized protein n=1 Tax=Arctium lappa TaxID=4217 RepID=A0ACB8XKH1_ARCLA|nr:hypothetical protein L6452_43108 [Arctium lappa]